MLKRLQFVGIMLFLLCITGTAYAIPSQGSSKSQVTQGEGTCSGVVTDATGETVIGASVVIKGTLTGTITDLDGAFSLANVPYGSTIVISFIGSVTQEVVWTGGALNVVLEDDSLLLDEVVVTALGMKRATKALGYAVTEMKGDELNKNVINPVSALQGKVAGVEISSGDGGLFGSSKILIRGASTLNDNNQPIYVVDGVILDNSVYVGDADWSTNSNDWGNELKNLNPDDFETVSVLKGAAATALYGSRGLNGAVVITTKSGKGAKKGLGINFTQTLGFDHVYRGPDFQNTFGEGYMAGYSDYKSSGNMNDTNSFYINGNGQRELVWIGAAWGPRFDGQDILYYNNEMVPYSANKHNFTDSYKDGFNTNTNVSISGNTETTSFYTSLSYKYAEGTTPNNTFDRFSFLAKASHKLSKDVEIEASISFANSTPKQGGETNFGEYFIDGTWDRMYDTNYWRTRYKGSHGGLAQPEYGDEYGYAPGREIWWNVFETHNVQKETMVRPTLKITADLTDWLKLSAEGNYNYYYKRNESKVLGSGYAMDGGSYSMGLYTKEQTNLNMNLTWNKTWGDFNFSGFLRGEYYHNFEQTMSESTNGGLVVPGQYFINNSKNTPSYSGTISGEKTIWSVAGQLSLSWRDQLFLDVTGRNDWSSSLVYADQHGNFSYFYPSVGLSWLIHETFDLPDWISFLKVRGSWAQVGNDTSAYLINSAYSLYTATTNVGDNYTLTIPTTAYDANLKPERKNSWEVGLDWRFINNRIGLDFTYYKENTRDQIMQISVPSVSGLSYEYVNAGNIQNQGIEIALNTTPIETKDWTWDLNLTGTHNASKIVSLHPDVADYISLTGDPAYGNYRIGSVARVGGEYGLLMSDAAPNYDEATGLPILELASYENRHTVYYTRSGEVREVGSMQPKFLAGLNTSLTWKDLTLSVSLDGRFGGMVAIYGSHYGTAYGYTESSLYKRHSEYGGMTFVSIWDGLTYDDGLIPNAMMPGGETISTPTGTYTIAAGGETYQSLYERGIVDPQHASAWTYWNNSWGRAAVTTNNDWFHELSYIALRDISITWRLPKKWASAIAASNLSIGAACHNVCYLYNSLPNHFNPESTRGTQASQFLIRSVSPYTQSYTFTISASF